MASTTALKGKTVFITGGSRGIGLAVAVRLAKYGANIAIAAKTADPNPKLPGTIYTAAKDIEKAGGQALPLVCDIRFEKDVEAAIQSTVDKFGGIDILINNASAIDLNPTTETSIKKFDLMNQINSRGTWLVSKLALPYLLESARKKRNPHILMMAPPLIMEQHWFAPHVGYTMAKYGMSMCVLGLSGELRDEGVGVNALWPMTGIETAAVGNVIAGGDESAFETTRTADIMSDAAHVILEQDGTKFTGNFCIDETLLRHQGIKNFLYYRSNPLSNSPLMADFFLPTDEASTLRDYPKKAAVGKQVLSSDYVQLVNRFKATTASAASKL